MPDCREMVAGHINTKAFRHSDQAGDITAEKELYDTQQSQNRSQQVFNVSNFHKWFIFGRTFCENDCHNFATHCHFAQGRPAAVAAAHHNQKVIRDR